MFFGGWGGVSKEKCYQNDNVLLCVFQQCRTQDTHPTCPARYPYLFPAFLLLYTFLLLPFFSFVPLFNPFLMCPNRAVVKCSINSWPAGLRQKWRWEDTKDKKGWEALLYKKPLFQLKHTIPWFFFFFLHLLSWNEALKKWSVPFHLLTQDVVMINKAFRQKDHSYHRWSWHCSACLAPRVLTTRRGATNRSPSRTFPLASFYKAASWALSAQEEHDLGFPPTLKS